MKKKLIAAGAASAVLAAMPVLGVFAEADISTVTDNINLTLLSTCAISRTGAAASAVEGKSSELSWTENTGTYAITLVGGKSATIGTSTFSVTCNDTTAGHYLAAQFTGLNGGTGITGAHIAYDGSAAVADDTSSWNATATVNSTLGVSAGLITATETESNPHSYVYNAALYGSSASTNKTAVSGQTFDITYAVGTANDQPSGSYTGSAVYTLTSGA